MKKPIFYVAFTMAASLCSLSYAAATTPSQTQPAQPTQQPSPDSGEMMKPMQSGQPLQYGQPQQQGAAPAPVDCSKLSAEELTFSTQFTDASNKTVFCQQLIPDQRTQVMAMSRQPDENGNMLTADQAMQKFMKDNNISSPAAPAAGTASPRRPSTGGGCPVQ